MAAGPISERNQDATIYVGGLDEKVSEALLWELFVQAGPVVNVHMPKDRVTQQHQGYGFVEFMGEEDADYAIKIMNMIKLYGKPIRVNKASAHQKNLDVGANIFIGNLDPEVDEKLLYDTFSAFGVILQTPKIMRDPETGNSKGYAFINFASFEASDAAIEAMNGQYLCNRPISISYAFKKDSKGERHGSAAERLLAAQNPLSQADRPHQLFADAPPPPQALPPAPPPPPSSMPPLGVLMSPLMAAMPPPPLPSGAPPTNVPPPPPSGMPPMHHAMHMAHMHSMPAPTATTQMQNMIQQNMQNSMAMSSNQMPPPPMGLPAPPPPPPPPSMPPTSNASSNEMRQTQNMMPAGGPRIPPRPPYARPAYLPRAPPPPLPRAARPAAPRPPQGRGPESQMGPPLPPSQAPPPPPPSAPPPPPPPPMQQQY
uniref:Splicing factor 3B subunit 4 n=1 Tax=Strigamia maritima TaxID=126957 RepID=T1J4C6_STRMM